MYKHATCGIKYDDGGPLLSHPTRERGGPHLACEIMTMEESDLIPIHLDEHSTARNQRYH